MTFEWYLVSDDIASELKELKANISAVWTAMMELKAEVRESYDM